MQHGRRQAAWLAPFCWLVWLGSAPAEAGRLAVELVGGESVESVGAVRRWDEDGNLRRPVDPRARIEAPQVDAQAVRRGSGPWVFEDLPAGTYDLVIMGRGRVRIEGFQFAPVLEFDPFLPPQAVVDPATRQSIAEDIAESRHYENRVQPLAMAGDAKVVRVLVMLIRDQPTSYEGYQPGAGTLRHEIWQYTWQYGGWRKEKRTKVLDRLLLPVSQLRRWTWLWDTELGGIKIGPQPVTVRYDLSRQKQLAGLRPY